jgi:hypothetical protein
MPSHLHDDVWVSDLVRSAVDGLTAPAGLVERAALVGRRTRLIRRAVAVTATVCCLGGAAFGASLLAGGARQSPLPATRPSLAPTHTPRFGIQVLNPPVREPSPCPASTRWCPVEFAPPTTATRIAGGVTNGRNWTLLAWSAAGGGFECDQVYAADRSATFTAVGGCFLPPTGKSPLDAAIIVSACPDTAPAPEALLLGHVDSAISSVLERLPDGTQHRLPVYPGPPGSSSGFLITTVTLNNPITQPLSTTVVLQGLNATGRTVATVTVHEEGGCPVKGTTTAH